MMKGCIFGRKVRGVGYKMKRSFICCICKKKSYGYGNNPTPVKLTGRCCDECNLSKVLPSRISNLIKYGVIK